MAALFALVAMATLTQISEVLLGVDRVAEMSIGLPLGAIFAFLIGLVFVAGLARCQLLAREEILVVYFILAIAAPMMTQGFWQRVVSISLTLPRAGDMQKFDAINQKLWPLGTNALAKGLQQLQEGKAAVVGEVSREASSEFADGLLILTGKKAGDKTQVRFELPVEKYGLKPGDAVVASFLVQLSGFAGDSRFSAGFREQGSDSYFSVAEGRSAGRFNPLLPKGFTRVGDYGIQLPPSGKPLWFEITLTGVGQLAIAGLQVSSVQAVETLYSGLQVTDDLAQVSPTEQSRTLENPKDVGEWILWKLGLGLVPWRTWGGPVLAWGGFAALVLMGSFGLNSLLRSRWVDAERVPLPLTRIPLLMTGLPFQSDEEPVKFWSNRIMWAGFGTAFAWAALKGWNFYNPEIPNLEVRVPLAPYLKPVWGTAGDISFEVSIVFLALAAFIESGVLLSAVVGFFLFRFVMFIGGVTGWDAIPRYPYGEYQQIGGFVTYAAILLLAARRQVVQVLLNPGSGGRTGLVVTVAAFVGLALWSNWLGISVWQMSALMVFLLIVALVSSRFRTECGVPSGYFMPTNAGYLFFILGGFGVFSPDFLFFSFAISFILLGTVFFVIPGAQLEFLEMGRRLRIPHYQVWLASGLGVLGGVVIGGWIFLSTGYSQGGDSVMNSWTFSPKMWFFSEYTVEMARVGASATPGQNTGEWLAVGYGAAGTAIIAGFRQLIAGFWLHPFGFIVGSTFLMKELWGTLLVAWVIRTVMLKVGGARTLRYGLQPFFGGVFLGGVAAWLLFLIIGGMIMADGASMIYRRVP